MPKLKLVSERHKSSVNEKDSAICTAFYY